MYKIALKVLANRVKSILSDIISDNQSTFVLDRSIFDNILILFLEVTYLEGGEYKGRNRGCAIIIDISKAYDRVRWIVVKGMLL